MIFTNSKFWKLRIKNPTTHKYTSRSKNTMTAGRRGIGGDKCNRRRGGRERRTHSPVGGGRGRTSEEIARREGT